MLNFKAGDTRIILFPEGKIDSNSSLSFKESCDSIIADHPNLEITIDCDKLQYISSAGLRVVLYLLKKYSKVSVINANPTLYDIFDATGFVDLLPVKKALKTISVEGCEIIGKGSNGIVYRYDPETIVKVYRNPDSLPDIENERKLSRYAFVHQIPTAISYEIVRVGNTFGSVFELLNANSLSKVIADDPDNYRKYVAVFVDILKTIHGQESKPGDVPSLKDKYLEYSDYIKLMLSDKEANKLVTMVSAVPENQHLVHGDYHSNNIMMQDDQALLIDMDTLSHGDPVFEFASIFNAYVGFDSIYHSVNEFLGLSSELAAKIWKEILVQYFEGETDEQLKIREDRFAVLGYTRLLRRQHKRYGTDTRENKETFEKCRSLLLDRLSRTDSLI